MQVWPYQAFRISVFFIYSLGIIINEFILLCTARRDERPADCVSNDRRLGGNVCVLLRRVGWN